MSMLPIRRSPMPPDADVSAGQGAAQRDTAGATGRFGQGDTGAGLSSARTPAIEMGLRDRAVSFAAVSTLRQVREDADRLAVDMGRVASARRAVSSVQRLVEQLRDVAVVSLDRSMEPASRATLQRQVDRTLADIEPAYW
jgi:hypothetical protein